MSEQPSGTSKPGHQTPGPSVDRPGSRPLVAAVRDAGVPASEATPGEISGEISGEIRAAGADTRGQTGDGGDSDSLVKLYWHLALTGFLTFAGFGVALVVARIAGHSDLMLLVLLAGSTGAVINNYYRLAKLSAVGQGSFDRFDVHVFTMQLYVSVLISGVLGFLVYGMCISGLVAGDLFPAFKGVQDDYASVTELLRNVSPAGNIDAVKAVVWAFIAGFSEKFIPNMIDRMADRAAARLD